MGDDLFLDEFILILYGVSGFNKFWYIVVGVCYVIVSIVVFIVVFFRVEFFVKFDGVFFCVFI